MPEHAVIPEHVVMPEHAVIPEHTVIPAYAGIQVNRVPPQAAHLFHWILALDNAIPAQACARMTSGEHNG